MLDIVMGLLSPNQGDVLIDNQAVTEKNIRSWQMHISHVPQDIYLADTTIEQNIAFGVPKEEINLTKVKQAAQQSQISKLVEGWPEQYNTIVGERGVRLSGGQRQRIGIARAFYKQADVLIFDEATSALDNKTEQELMDAIDNLNRELTILIIAHRLTTLKNCDLIISFGDDGKPVVGKYEELII
jgi:ATP-binding cassette subfamily B protein